MLSTYFGITTNQIVVSSLIVCAISGAVYALTLNYRKRKHQYFPVAKISKLIIYPIKSLPGIEVDNAFISKCGLTFAAFRDRSWLLIDNDNRFITQRNENSLALLKTSLHINEIWVESKDVPILKLKVKEKQHPNDIIIKTKVWGQAIDGVYCGKEAEEWFSQYLQKPGIKLIQHLPNLQMRSSGAQVNDNVVKLNEFPILYQDGSGLLLISESSIHDLNDRLPQHNKVSYRNFRPNLLVNDCNPYEEDQWEVINVNDVHFTSLKPCDRCVLTTINPDTGIKDDDEPLKTLRTYRLAPKHLKKWYGESPLFGINFGPETEGQISVGDIVFGVYRKN